MAKEFEINTSRLESLMRLAPKTAFNGAKAGMHEALDDWVKESRDIAPIDTGTLRRGIKSDGIKSDGKSIVGELSSTAIEQTSSGPFNYAYYIHEENAGGKNVGGVKQYLDAVGEQEQAKWLRWIEEDIENALKGGGW
jgi:hypothetical protein